MERAAIVISMLILSMGGGTMVLSVLGVNAPAAGEFCLSSYYALGPIEQVTRSRAAQKAGRWSGIEVAFQSPEQFEKNDGQYHFLVYGGIEGSDGQIIASDKWDNQMPAVSDNNLAGRENIIRVLVLLNQNSATNFQVKRTEMLVERLCRGFVIVRGQVRYPVGWRY